jgi:uncharacterized membrane protein
VRKRVKGEKKSGGETRVSRPLIAPPADVRARARCGLKQRRCRKEKEK